MVSPVQQIDEYNGSPVCSEFTSKPSSPGTMEVILAFRQRCIHQDRGAQIQLPKTSDR